ncbi:MAG TPA: hypothetical protein VNN19_01365 [bacterium]|nr:hypothetical protein [bacterium]
MMGLLEERLAGDFWKCVLIREEPCHLEEAFGVRKLAAAKGLPAQRQQALGSGFGQVPLGAKQTIHRCTESLGDDAQRGYRRASAIPLHETDERLGELRATQLALRDARRLPQLTDPLS